MHRLEEDLDGFKRKNSDLAEQLLSKAGEPADEAPAQLKEKTRLLEQQLAELRKEREDMLNEREEEMRIVQEALEEAQEEKLSIQARFEQDFEKLRTVNTDREQQLLDDFEWKLREVEQACKRRLEERDRAAEERLRQLRQELEAEHRDQDSASQLKSCEAEVTQLRGLTHEQQRSLRNAARQTEQLQVSERMLKEEIARLQSSLDKEKAHYSAMQTIHDRRMAEFEKKLQSRLDQQKSELTAFWEDRMRKECARLKTELDQIHTEQQNLAMESVKAQKEQDMQAAKEEWDRKLQGCAKEVSSLRKQAAERDSHHQAELQRLQTNADRDILELRRKLDKLDMSYQEQIERLVEKHEREMQQLSEESERRVQQLEQNWQLQATSTRTTLELVKEQMERDARARLEEAEERHRSQLAQQWDQLMEQKDQALQEEARQQHVLAEEVKAQLEAATTSHKAREAELLETIADLRGQLEGQSTAIGGLQGSVDLLEGGMQVLNQQITGQEQELARAQQQAAHKLRERDAHWEAELRRRLAELAARHEEQRQQWRSQVQQFQRKVQDKIAHLSKLLEESRKRYENRESRPEDLKLIAALRQAVEDKDRELASLKGEGTVTRPGAAPVGSGHCWEGGGPGGPGREDAVVSPRAPVEGLQSADVPAGSTRSVPGASASRSTDHPPDPC
ncbi:protein FAM184A-like isoform X4 [Bacillus rossius redtenbacheri]